MKMFIAAAAALVLGASAHAAEIEVQMLNQGTDGERMVFEPAVIEASVGDTIRFIPVDKGHNAATVKRAIPDGAETVRGKINEEIVYEVTAEGVYVFECTPHAAMGMLAVMVVGDDLSNLEAIAEARLPRKARERLEGYLDTAGLSS